MENDLLYAEDLHKAYGAVEAVRGVSLRLASGDFLAIMGRSGSGKSTLLHMLAGLEGPSHGRIVFQNEQLGDMNADQLALWRRKHIGLVFQSFHLVPTLSAIENVAFPLYPTEVPAAERRRRAQARLEQVGLGHRLTHRPTQLSGGEQQRVAIARALINQPQLILADEPTGNLDSQNGAELMELLSRLNRSEGVAVLIITHDPIVAEAAHRVLTMKDGQLEEQAAIAR